MRNKFKNNNKNGNFTLKCFDDQLVSDLFSVSVFRPKFAATGLPTNFETRNLRLFLIRLYFCCLLDQDLKGQCR